MEMITKEEIVDVLNRIYVMDHQAAEDLCSKIKLECNFRFTDCGNIFKSEGNEIGILDLLNGLFKTRHKSIRVRRDEAGELVHFIVARYEMLDDETNPLPPKAVGRSELKDAKKNLFALLMKKCVDGLTDVEAGLMDLLKKDKDLAALLEEGI